MTSHFNMADVDEEVCVFSETEMFVTKCTFQCYSRKLKNEF